MAEAQFLREFGHYAGDGTCFLNEYEVFAIDGVPGKIPIEAANQMIPSDLPVRDFINRYWLGDRPRSCKDEDGHIRGTKSTRHIVVVTIVYPLKRDGFGKARRRKQSGIVRSVKYSTVMVPFPSRIRFPRQFHLLTVTLNEARSKKMDADGAGNLARIANVAY
jgi:hypothetical protein